MPSPERRQTIGKPSRRQRRTLSCLPCRLYKLRCDRVVPCESCCRYGREDRCRLNPPPAAVMGPSGGHGTPAVFPRVETQTPPSNSTRGNLPPTPSSVTESFRVAGISPVTEPDDVLTLGTSVPKRAANDPTGFIGSGLSHHHHGGQAELLTSFEGVTVASAIISRSYNLSNRTLLDEPASYWRRYLVSILPSQTQCDMLVSYFFENINWIYQAVHAPSFRSEYAEFWSTEVDKIDLIWLALLYMMLCLGALFIPSPVAEAAGFEASDLPVLYRRWYAAARQALQAGNYESKPTLTQIQVFLVSQIYWYSTKNVEVLNSHMGQAIRNAQALGLDKELPQSNTNCLEREMRHRIWWDLVSSDT